jgi:hypothetical protein
MAGTYVLVGECFDLDPLVAAFAVQGVLLGAHTQDPVSPLARGIDLNKRTE